MLVRTVCFILLASVALPEIAGADYLEVRHNATIRESPSGDAVILERVEPGTLVPLLQDGQTRGYYLVRGPATGAEGWIYRTLVRRHRGEFSGDEEPVLDPLADPSLHLTSEERATAARHLALGKPQAVYERVREGYVLAQDARLKIPLWVQYELRPADLIGDLERSEDFRPDTSIPYGARAELSDYQGSGLDRGHMAPAADMERSETVMSESFLLSNMAPQVGAGFNRGIWRSLETAVRGWVEQRGPLTIITGPVFAPDSDQVVYPVIGAGHVAVPTGFYKIVVDPDHNGEVATLAFLLPNESLTGHQIEEYLVAVDEIESLTGLDFLGSLSAEEQERVESDPAEVLW